jgi:hypothetical protein
MVSSPAPTIAQYLASLPPERRAAVAAVRDVVRRNLPRGFAEGMQYGMIGWYVPRSRIPATYNGQPVTFAGLASQRQYMSLYLMSVYGDPATQRWFTAEWKKTGKKLDMGKSCLRFRSLDDLPLDLIGRVIARADFEAFCARIEQVYGSARKARAGQAQGQRGARPATAQDKPAARKGKGKGTSAARTAKAKPATRAAKAKPAARAAKAKPATRARATGPRSRARR